MDSMVKAAAERLRKIEKQRELSAADRRNRAIAFARSLACDLGRADPTLQKIIGFGSTFERWRPYRMNSDIDLGILGGDWALLGRTVPSAEFDVSIVELELQNQEFSDYVRKHGEVLYEKS